MRLFTILLILALSSCGKSDSSSKTPDQSTIDDDLDGPIPRPTSGYGKDGTYAVAKDSFPSPLYAGKYVCVFHPAGVTTPRPILFFSHPYGGEESSYNIGLFNFIAKKGYVIVFAPYPTLGVSIDDRYNTLWTSFTTAVKNYSSFIDTNKVGFVGHSFGGAASFGLSWKAFQRGWGNNGRFIFAMAQWYAYQLEDSQLTSFPANTKLITQVYDDDVTNDHRLAIDIFKHINIPNAEKDFILLRKSVLPDYTYIADHVVPNSRSAYDAYDYYGIYRLLDAMIDYSFNGVAAAKNICLGNGSAEQVTMPSYKGTALAPLEVTDNPVPQYPQGKYQFPCSSLNNPRLGNCQ